MANNSALEVARAYIHRGWCPVPVPFRDKNPNTSEWQKLHLTDADLAKHFNGKPQNIGVLLGEASNGLADLDLDSREAVAMGRYYAPDTAAVFGRPSKRRSHRLYSCSDAKYEKLLDPLDGSTILEIRAGTGKQTVFPGSTHESGEPITWDADGEPFEIAADELKEYAHKLAAAALLAKCWPNQGGRHDAALALAGGLLRAGWQDADAEYLIQAIAECAGDGEVEDRVKCVTTTRACMATNKPFKGWPTLAKILDPRVVSRVCEWLGIQAQARETESPRINGFNLTDMGNGERLVARHGQDLRYCNAWGKWLVWDGIRWAVDDTKEVERRAKETVRAIYAEAAATVDDVQRKDLARWAAKSEARSRVEAMIAMAGSEPGVAVSPDDLDADPWLFNCLNVTLDLRTGTERPHNRADLLTKLAPVEYHADADAPRFLAFLNRIMGDKPQLVTFLQRATGYTLTGSIRERAFFIAHGQGDNGKTTLLEIVQSMMGDYASRTPTETLMVRRDGGIPNDLARLKGTRFAFASEAEEGRRLAVSLIKDMTGGDTITARFMRAEFFEFKPEFKLWLATNHKPVIKDTNKAIWRRIRLIPFAVSIPEAEQDKKLPEKLMGELPGILAWAVRGCVAWQQEGLEPPAEVKDATDKYRADSDDLAAWLAECCHVAADAATLSSSALESYIEFTGDKKMTKNEFAKRMLDRGFTKKRVKAGIVWLGFGLLKSTPPDGGPGVDLSEMYTSVYDLGISTSKSVSREITPKSIHKSTPGAGYTPGAGDEQLTLDDMPPDDGPRAPCSRCGASFWVNLDGRSVCGKCGNETGP